MALLGNYSVLYKSPGYWRSGGATGQGLDRCNSNRSGPQRNRYNAYTIDPKTAFPGGTAPGNAIVIQQKPGGMGSRNNSVGIATVSGSGALGRNISGTSDGSATTTATGILVVSGSGTSDGVATVSGTIVAALAASGTADGVATTSALATAAGWMSGSASGAASSTSVLNATGALSGSIEVGAAAELTAGAIAEEVLDSQMVETGLTVRETLRLCAAALAGKVSISGNTVTIRNAVADDTDRIVATTTTGGERTAITYDVG